MAHLLVELSNSKDRQMNEASDRQDEAQASGEVFCTTLSSLPDIYELYVRKNCLWAALTERDWEDNFSVSRLAMNHFS